MAVWFAVKGLQPESVTGLLPSLRVIGITPPQRRLGIPPLFIFCIPFSTLIIKLLILPRFLAEVISFPFHRFCHRFLFIVSFIFFILSRTENRFPEVFSLFP
ncbi:hypothetical protein V6Z12_D04G082200 [Gossypium hirsutum]